MFFLENVWHACNVWNKWLCLVKCETPDSHTCSLPGGGRPRSDIAVIEIHFKKTSFPVQKQLIKEPTHIPAEWCHPSTPLSHSLRHSLCTPLLLLFDLYCVCVLGKGKLAHLKEKIALCFYNRCVCYYAGKVEWHNFQQDRSWGVEIPPRVSSQHSNTRWWRCCSVWRVGCWRELLVWPVSVGLHTATVA